MAENKNTELNDELMKDATGGDGQSRARTEPGTVIGPFDDYTHSKYRVKRDQGPEAIASYYAIGKLLEPGTRVMIALVGQGQWEIVQFL